MKKDHLSLLRTNMLIPSDLRIHTILVGIIRSIQGLRLVIDHLGTEGIAPENAITIITVSIEDPDHEI